MMRRSAPRHRLVVEAGRQLQDWEKRVAAPLGRRGRRGRQPHDVEERAAAPFSLRGQRRQGPHDKEERAAAPLGR